MLRYKFVFPAGKGNVAMLLDLSRFRAGTEHLDRIFDAAALVWGDDDFRMASPVRLVADVRKDAQKVRMVGRVTGTLEVDCSRCLEAYPITLDSTFDLLFLPA